jgi:outer membrane PBP1 activator LpoA protein
MQRFPWLLLLVLVTGCATAPPAPVESVRVEAPSPQPPPKGPEAAPVPQEEGEVTVSPLGEEYGAPVAAAPLPPGSGSTPPSAIIALPAPTLPPSERAPPAPAEGAMALILPINSPAFGRAAEAVRDGFLAAYAQAPKGALPMLTVYPVGHDPADILSSYAQALQAGSRVVVGPLTRDGVTALARSNLVSVPTVALNVPDSDVPIPGNLYLFGLRVESEARQVATLARGPEGSRAFVIYGETPVEKRIYQAFADEWRRLGGRVIDAVPFDPDTKNLLRLKSTATSAHTDVIFLALESQKARLVKAFLDPAVSTYATSQVYGGRSSALSNHDLNGVRFVDMPWMIAPQHPAVARYARPEGATTGEFERLYALGIDALRIAEMLLASPRGPIALQGVTGAIRLDEGNRLERELVPGAIRQGEAAALEGFAH